MYDDRLLGDEIVDIDSVTDGSCWNLNGGGRGNTDFMKRSVRFLWRKVGVCCWMLLEMADKEAIRAHLHFGSLLQGE